MSEDPETCRLCDQPGVAPFISHDPGYFSMTRDEMDPRTGLRVGDDALDVPLMRYWLCRYHYEVTRAR